MMNIWYLISVEGKMSIIEKLLLTLTWLGRQPWSGIWRWTLRPNLGSLRRGHLPALLRLGFRLSQGLFLLRIVGQIFCTIRLEVLTKTIGTNRVFLITLFNWNLEFVFFFIAHLDKVGGEHADPPGQSALPPAVLHLAEELHHLVNLQLELVLVHRLVREQDPALLLVPQRHLLFSFVVG